MALDHLKSLFPIFSRLNAEASALENTRTHGANLILIFHYEDVVLGSHFFIAEVCGKFGGKIWLGPMTFAELYMLSLGDEQSHSVL